MGEPWLVRPAAAGDLQRIHDIYNDAVLTGTATWDLDPWTMAQRMTWWEEHCADASMPVVVAEHDARVIGFACLSKYRPKPGYRFTREDTVYVEPDFHGRGVGRALLTPIIAGAAAHGTHAILALIEASNEASIALHRSFGFELAGLQREIGFKFDRWLDLVTMELLFSDTSQADREPVKR